MGQDRSIARLVTAAMCLLISGCAVPQPTTAPATQAPAPGTKAPAPATATPVPVMASHGLAHVVASAGAQSWSKPGGRGKKLELLPVGATVYLMQSATARDGSTWWGTPVQAGIYSGPTSGWIAEIGTDDSPVLQPINPECPTDAPRSAADLPDEGWTRLACYGMRELELEGRVACQQGVAELSVQGAPWTDSYRWCGLDDLLPLYGQAVTSLLDGANGSTVGQHVVRGHFDDQGATHCVGTGFGVSLGASGAQGEPAAIQLCRQDFVVDQVLPPSGG